MKILQILYHLLRRADRAWALREINPLDPSVPKVVLSWHRHNQRLKELMP